jgi:carboxypeptidase C (cathepsin A)
MVSIYWTKLHWQPDGVYHLLNADVFRQWDWGRGMGRAEAISFLQDALAVDLRLHVLIVHGLADLRTPYFATALILDQLPDRGSADRVSLRVFPGGHMLYSQDGSRAALRDAAQALFGVQ